MSERTATVGCIKPTRHSGSHADLVRLLPEGITTTARRLNIRHGTIGEFESVMADYEVEVARFAAEGVDLIHPEGTPPFMLKGLAGEQSIVARWQDTHGVPVFTSAMSQADALRALGITRFVGVGYDFEDTEIVARYFRDAGFDVIALDRPRTTAWEDIDNLPAERVFELIRDLARRHPGAEGIYIQGSKWRVLDIVERLEAELGLPVVHPVTARCWEMQKRTGIERPLTGFGRLLAALPARTG
jgi:maleate cis-trans isomerase